MRFLHVIYKPAETRAMCTLAPAGLFVHYYYTRSYRFGLNLA